MNPCHRFQQWVSAAMDQELCGEEQTQLQQHLAHCADCRAWRGTFQDVNQLLTRGNVEPVPGAMDRLRSRLESQWIHPRRRQLLKSRLALAMAVAATALLGMSLFTRWRTPLARLNTTTVSLSEPVEALQYIHRAQEQTQSTLLESCDWELRSLALEVRTSDLDVEQKQRLLLRVAELQRMVVDCRESWSILREGS